MELRNDVEALGRILANEYTGFNRYGETLNKADILDLFRTFKRSRLSRAEADVRFAGDIAIVTGSQVEVNATGAWRLLSSTQLIPFNSNSPRQLRLAQGLRVN